MGIDTPPVNELFQYRSDFIIYGYKNTMAEIYAEKNNLNFIALDLQGDPNQDGEVNIADVVAVSSYVADSEKIPFPNRVLLTLMSIIPETVLMPTIA